MKKGLLLFGMFAALTMGPGVFKQFRRDTYLPTNVVQLIGPGMRGSCTGVHISYEGKTYILSAAHCLVLAQDGKILVRDDQMEFPVPLSVLKEDDEADLILLEPLPDHSGISIADYISRGETVYTYTHGKGMATYKTEGVYIQDMEIEVPLFIPDERLKCDTNKPKYRLARVDFGFFSVEACVLSENTLVTTAMIVPGSSGGPVVNKYGELLGIVSAGDGDFGFLVTLDDIQRFVENYK